MNIKINFGEIITKAWKITWKFKVLWIFGILAGCAGGNSGSNYNFNSGTGNRNIGNGSNSMPDFFKNFNNMQPWQALQNKIGEYVWVIALVITLLCVLWLVFYFLGMMGKIGLIKGASKGDEGAEQMSFGELWTESLPYFWRMTGLNVLVGLPIALGVLVILAIFIFGVINAINSGSAGAAGGAGAVAILLGMMGVFVSLMCVIGLIATIVSLIVHQAENALVLEEQGVLDALGRGWDVFKSAWFTVVVMAVLLGILSFGAGLVMAIPLIVPAIALGVGLGLTSAVSSGVGTLPLILAGGCFVLYLPVIITLSGMLQTYMQSAWTLTYRRLTAKPVVDSAAVIDTGAGAIGPQ
jgi:hypothetical protein